MTQPRFNPPPSWPAPADPHWTPPAGFHAPPGHAPAPAGWRLVMDPAVEAGPVPASELVPASGTQLEEATDYPVQVSTPGVLTTAPAELPPPPAAIRRRRGIIVGSLIGAALIIGTVLMFLKVRSIALEDLPAQALTLLINGGV